MISLNAFAKKFLNSLWKLFGGMAIASVLARSIMKLQYSLHLAFTTLLLIIMAVTGYVIYSLILDLLIQDEQRQLEQKGQILVNVLNEQYETEQDIQKFYDFLQEQDLQLFLYDRTWDTV